MRCQTDFSALRRIFQRVIQQQRHPLLERCTIVGDNQIIRDILRIPPAFCLIAGDIFLSYKNASYIAFSVLFHCSLYRKHIKNPHSGCILLHYWCSNVTVTHCYTVRPPSLKKYSCSPTRREIQPSVNRTYSTLLEKCSIAEFASGIHFNLIQLKVTLRALRIIAENVILIL